jgi:hypothetical protein
MKKPVIVAVIPCWGRAEVFALVSKQLDLFYEKTRSKIDFIVLYVFSPEDPELDSMFSVYNSAEYTKHFIYAGNKLLGAKLNAGIVDAARFNYDYIMNLGSDDLIHPNLMNIYLPQIYVNVMVIGISALFFYKKDLPPVYFFYYNNPHVIGAGRLIHRDVVKTVTEKYGALYSPDLKRGMDTFSANRINACGFPEKSIYKGSFPYIVDIKSDVNINSWEQIIKSDNNDRYIQMPLSVIENEFSNLQIFKSSNLKILKS